MINNIRKKLFTGMLIITASCALLPAGNTYRTLADTIDESDDILDDNLTDDDDYQFSSRLYDIGFSEITTISDEIYTGKPIEPSPLVSIAGNTLVRNKDYVITYINNTNVSEDGATIIITGIGNYHGSNQIHFAISPRLITDTTYSINGIGYTYYTGDEITFSPGITVNDKKMYDENDFYCTFENNKNVGIGTVTLNFCDNYMGEITKSFYILPEQPVITRRVSTSASKATITWNQVNGADGYYLEKYDNKSKTYKNLCVVKSGSKTYTTITGLTNNEATNIRIRAYITNSKGSKLYGKSSTYKFTAGRTVSNINLNYISSSFKIADGQKRTLKYTVSPNSATVKRLIFTSSNEDVATVNYKGEVTGQKPGTAIITAQAYDGSLTSKTVKVTVTKRADSFSYDDSKLKIVSTNHQKYTYNEMQNDITQLKNRYSEYLSVKNLGLTYDKRNIYEVILGNPDAENQILICGSTHAREYMTSLLIMKQIEFYCTYYYTGIYDNMYFNEVFDNTCIHFVPMLNPDGVTISQSGPSAIRNKTLRANLYKMKKQCGGGSSFFTRWKANARGVDLNRNYDSDGTTSFKNGKPRDNGYCGPSAISEKETKILSNLFLSLKPDAMISYHATGSIIYWKYGQTGDHYSNSVKFYNTAHSLTGYYPVRSVSTGGGFSNWTSARYHTPSMTIEIGTGSAPLKISEFKNILKRNRYVPLAEAITVANTFLY